MVLRFFLFAVAFLFASCTELGERDNPDDPHGINFRNSSSSVEASSSSSSVELPLPTSSSSSVAVPSSSSVAPPLSSSSSVPTQSGVILGTPVSYEGETYQTVVIGVQTWFKRNLNYKATGSKCYDNKESNCTTYGRLYDWATAMALPPSCNTTFCSGQITGKHKGICPAGWHIPSEDDWDVLMTEVGGASTAGKYLKTSDWGGEDTYGFSALPGGGGDSSSGGFGGVGNNGSWLSATEYDYDASYAYYRNMSYVYANVFSSYYDKGDFISVRCVQD
ncbi:MAG: hypothetical protein LBC75_09835 [Fibromonadaceae bacterium]|jgi:uncharacterized protein (TIGR02145 family)|nr:hypothetical protein [Fibromonadaceae bacterium]